MNHPIKHTSLRVITVDDSNIIADRLNGILKELKNVQLLGNAYNTSAAAYLIQQEKPHVVILDINFKNSSTAENGINLLSLIKEKHSEIKVIMLTNLAGIFYQNLCRSIGADLFLDKSCDFDKIQNAIVNFRDHHCGENKS
jgi:DNA-binding NarL/FixJ family response regulator